MCKQRDQASLNEQINLDLTYSVSLDFVCQCFSGLPCSISFGEYIREISYLLQVLFNLANQYHANKMFSEALNTYLLIVKNKMFTNGGACACVHVSICVHL